jgi:hypothetical protein
VEHGGNFVKKKVAEERSIFLTRAFLWVSIESFMILEGLLGSDKEVLNRSAHTNF